MTAAAAADAHTSIMRGRRVKHCNDCCRSREHRVCVRKRFLQQIYDESESEREKRSSGSCLTGILGSRDDESFRQTLTADREHANTRAATGLRLPLQRTRITRSEGQETRVNTRQISLSSYDASREGERDRGTGKRRRDSRVHTLLFEG